MKFAFDGGDTTARQLKQAVPVYSEGALQTALESGCKSIPEVMAFMAHRDLRLHGDRVRSGQKARRMKAYSA